MARIMDAFRSAGEWIAPCRSARSRSTPGFPIFREDLSLLPLSLRSFLDLFQGERKAFVAEDRRDFQPAAERLDVRAQRGEVDILGVLYT